MCGRFVAASPPDEIGRYFGASEMAEQLLKADSGPNYNVAPTTDVAAVVEHRADEGVIRRLDAFHWGLVPVWAKDPSIGNRMINARAETVAEKNSYKRALRKTRCIIPADGFYEWKKVPGSRTKQPVYIHRVDGEPLAFAGLYERWYPKDADGNRTDHVLESCTIITTSANSTMAPVHDRMPVILSRDEWDRWLDPDNDDIEGLLRLLDPAPADLLTLYPVDTAVGNVRNKGRHLIDPIPPDDALWTP